MFEGLAVQEELKKKCGFELVGGESCGFHWVISNGKEFHVKPDGTPAYPQRFKWVGPFKERGGKVTAIVFDDDGKAFKIDTEGNKVS